MHASTTKRCVVHCNTKTAFVRPNMNVPATNAVIPVGATGVNTELPLDVTVAASQNSSSEPQVWRISA